uniref:FLYWCH-type domain-containing protein n=1 Tax=Meloidogyne javanica TaxID=6303 RepID=A0A915N9T7_MELJA
MNRQSNSSREDGEIRDISDEIKYDLNVDDDETVEENTLVRFYSTISTRGKELLRRDGYEFTFDKPSKLEEGTEQWKCVRQKPYCKGRIHVRQNWIYHEGKKYKLGTIKNGQHNHPAKAEAVRDAQNLLREKAISENPPAVRNAVKLARERVPIEVRATGECSSSSTMGRSYRNYIKKARRDVGDDSLDVENPNNIIIPNRIEEKIMFSGQADGLDKLMVRFNMILFF